MVTAILESELPAFPDALERAKIAARRVLDELQYEQDYGTTARR